MDVIFGSHLSNQLVVISSVMITRLDISSEYEFTLDNTYKQNQHTIHYFIEVWDDDFIN